LFESMVPLLSIYLSILYFSFEAIVNDQKTANQRQDKRAVDPDLGSPRLQPKPALSGHPRIAMIMIPIFRRSSCAGRL
jgi:hypothetical protein